MKKAFISGLVYFLISFSSLLFPLKSYGALGDTIKPITRIDKEFLIVVHVVLDQDSNSSLSSSALADEMKVVNQIFAPIGASFTVCDYRSIYNFQYQEITDSTRKELMDKYHVPSRINMYFLQDIIGDIEVCGNADLGGVKYSDSHNGIVIRYGECANATTIAHELGHYFGLPHTFEGRGDELADGSNCSTAGDKICDTPGDPFYEGGTVSKYVNGECVFFHTEKDANGDYYDPDVSNLMGYYSHCRCLQFTRGQLNYMSNYYFQNPFLW